MALLDSQTKSRGWYRDGLRGWLDAGRQSMGELRRSTAPTGTSRWAAHPDAHREEPRHRAGDPVRRRPGLSEGLSARSTATSPRVRRIALTLGLPLEYERKVDVVQRYHARMQDMKPLPPRFVNDGPIFENVLEGDDIDVLKFPVPRHHEQDKSRFIGTADCVMTQDPDAGWFNLGAYRSQVYDGKTVGCQITEGKHGRIHRDKYFERGQPMKVVIVCGQDPLLFMLSSSPLPEIGEMDIAGGLRGEPIDVVRGPYTGFPIPADCRDRDRRRDRAGPGEARRAVRRMDGLLLRRHPAAALRQREDHPLSQRPDPHLRAAAQAGRRDRPAQGHRRRGADLARARCVAACPKCSACGTTRPGPATRFTVIQIKQRYPGHARQALHVAAACQGGAYAGKWTVVVDDDIDAGDLDQVLWAMCTRFDPYVDIDLIQKAWASKRDPLFLPGNFNNRILIDACIPYDMKLKGTFPVVVDVSADLRATIAGEVPASVSADVAPAVSLMLAFREADDPVNAEPCGSVVRMIGRTGRPLSRACSRSWSCRNRARAKRRGLLQGQVHQPGRSASRSAAATTSTPGISPATWASTSPAIRPSCRRTWPARGSLRAANFIYTAAPKDGTAFGTFARTTGINPLLESGATFDGTKFSWLGSVTDDVSLCVTWHTSAVKTWEDFWRSRRRSAARDRARSPTFSRGSTRTCSAHRSSSSPAIPAPTRSRWRWSAARSTACAGCRGARSRRATRNG